MILILNTFYIYIFIKIRKKNYHINGFSWIICVEYGIRHVSINAMKPNQVLIENFLCNLLKFFLSSNK